MNNHLILSAGLLVLSPALVAETLPSLQLASVYPGGLDLSGYLVSQKYDGVRVYWDGSRLRSRSGNWLALPAELVQQLPAFALDAELWLGTGRFAELQALLQRPLSDPAYSELKLMVFDAPQHTGPFGERQQFLRRMLPQSSFIQLVAQQRLTRESELQQLLQQVESAGGEGLMLHRLDARYQAGRVSHLLKLKSYTDAEARVVAHLPGKGQFAGVLGSLLVELPDGRRFKLGTGFSLAERKAPPAIGRWVRFKYQGLTHKEIPRFAVFLSELDQNTQPQL